MASFALGAGLIAAAVSPPIGDWAHHDLRGHMVQHLLLGMFAPLALVLAAPITLLLKVLPAQGGRRVVSFLATRPLRVLVHPVTAAMLDIGGMYLLYLTPLYALSVTNPLVHVLVHLHFVLSGYLFAWSIAGPDPAPRRPGFRARLCVLFIATAAHSTLAKLMYAHGFPRGGSHGIAEIEAAAQWMYYGGDVAELLLAVAFFGAWFHARSRPPGMQCAAGWPKVVGTRTSEEASGNGSGRWMNRVQPNLATGSGTWFSTPAGAASRAAPGRSRSAN